MDVKSVWVRFGISLWVILAMATSVFSEEEKEVTLEEVKVVASPIIEGNRVDDYGNRVTTVTEKQVEDLNALDFPSALRRTPGVTISRYNIVGSYGGDQGGSIYIRGMGGERPGAEIQTLVDGRPSFVGIWTHPLMDLMSVSNLGHVDVYKGVQPVLFGNMTYGAVNIVTKRMMEEGFTTRIRSAYGSYNTFDEHLEHGGKKGDFDYYLIGDFKKSDGHRENSDGRVQNYFGRMGYRFADAWDASLTMDYADSYADDPGREGAPPIPVVPRFKVWDQVYDLTVSNKYEIAKGFLKVYYDGGHIRWRDQWDAGAGVAFDTNTDWSNYGVRAQERLNLWTSGEVVLGYDHDVYGGKAEEVRPATVKSLEDIHFYNSAPYFEVRHTFGKEIQFTPSAGLRYNMSKYFGDFLAPEAGLVLRYKGTELYARYAKGFNLPGVYTVFFYELNFGQGDKWKDLKPEKIDHYEVGGSQKITQWLKADVAFFYDSGKDRLVFQTPPPRFENLQRYRTRGIELTATVTPWPNFELFTGGTYLASSPSDLPYAPHVTLSAGVSYALWEKIFINLDSQYVSSRYVSNPRYPTATPGKVDSYYLVNGKISYRIKPIPYFPFKGEAEVFLAGENLTNVHYACLPGYPMPGTTVMGGIGLKF
jgi:outer membrane receptor protein involved in Fe transport